MFPARVVTFNKVSVVFSVFFLLNLASMYTTLDSASMFHPVFLV